MSADINNEMDHETLKSQLASTPAEQLYTIQARKDYSDGWRFGFARSSFHEGRALSLKLDTISELTKIILKIRNAEMEYRIVRVGHSLPYQGTKPLAIETVKHFAHSQLN